MSKFKFDLKPISPINNIITNSPLYYKKCKVSVFKSNRDWKDYLPPIYDKPGIWDNILAAINLGEKKETPEHREERLKLEKEDKIELLEKVIKDTDFFGCLDKRAIELKKKKKS